MVTDIFFDLQRFADDTLVGGETQFTWKNGSRFAGSDDPEVTAEIGSADNPAHMSTTGEEAVTLETIHLNGTAAGYTLAIEEEKSVWEAQLQGTANVLTGNRTVANGSYGVTGDITLGIFGGKTFSETVNGASIIIPKKADGAVLLSASTGNAGVDSINGLDMADAIHVTGDADGYTAIFNKATGTGDVAITANNAVVNLNAGYVDEANVTVNVASSGSEATIKGIEANAIITLESAATYHFKDASDSNKVVVSSGDTVNVTLDGAGNVYDQMGATAQKRHQSDTEKWEEVASIGGTTDTDGTHHGQVYESFYNLAGGTAAGKTLAGYIYDDDTAPVDATSTINIIGQSPKGVAAIVDDAKHVTLQVGSGDYAGQVPINIQSNENASVVDVVIDASGANTPSTVAVGTTGAVTASHEIHLSNSSSGANYGYLGSLATGQNKLIAGSGAAMLRHDGSQRASVFGGSGNDTIRAAANDYVLGNAGTDYFYDSASYTISDYDVTQGDAIIAMKLNSLSDITPDNIRGTGNQIGFGSGSRLLTMGNIDANAALHVKVAVADTDANVQNGVRDIVLANGNGVVDGTVAGTNGALIDASARRGVGVHNVVGSAGSDDIYIGASDYVDGAGGNDNITIDEDSSGAVVALTNGGGTDTVKNWVFGFNPYPNAENNGSTKLYVGNAGFQGRVLEDRLHISIEGGAAMVFDDTAMTGSKHGQYDVLIGTDNGDKKYTAIRYIPGVTTYASVTSNDEVADFYLAEQNGNLTFTKDVTQDLGWIYLDGVTQGDVITQFVSVRNLTLNNNSHASVVGSANRETLNVGGDYEARAGKAVSLGGDNDVINSDGEDGAGHTFYFGVGDGRDTINSFNHFVGYEVDADVQKADTLVFNVEGVGVRVDSYSDGDRIVFNTTANDDVVIYESEGLKVNDNLYRVKIAEREAKYAKIGYSTKANVFQYDAGIDYYVGNSVEQQDTLSVGANVQNAEIWLDGSKNGGQIYRGIAAIDASGATATNLSLVGGANDNTIVGGGEGTTNWLWGGAGDNFLQGSSGKDYFLYYAHADQYISGAAGQTVGNHDTVNGYDFDNDSIYLGDVTLADIASTEIGDNSISVEFKNGGELTVAGTQEKTRFYFTNGTFGGVGQVWTADRSTKTWTRDV